MFTGAQVRRLKGELAARYTVAEDDVVQLFQERLRELLMPHLEGAIRLGGRHDAERALTGRLRAAVDYARIQDLLPRADKGKKEAEAIRHVWQVDAFSH